VLSGPARAASDGRGRETSEGEVEGKAEGRILGEVDMAGRGGWGL